MDSITTARLCGVIGTGAMGAGMVANLLERGYRVHIRDIDPAREAPLVKRGALVQPNPRSVIAAAAAVFIVVETAAQIDDVLRGTDGLLAGIRPGDPVFLCSTIGPVDAERFAAEIVAAGGQAIDAPISGGPVRARDGSMSMMLAAPFAVLDHTAALISAVAGRIFRVSARPGDATRAKLANNLAAGAYLTAASEALAMATKLGLDPVLMQGLMAASSGQSWIADDRLPRALNGLCAPVGAALRVLDKDLALAVAAAQAVGACVPMGEVASRRFQDAMKAGLGELDDSAMYVLYSGRPAGIADPSSSG